MNEPNSPSGYKPAPWEEAAPVRGPVPPPAQHSHAPTPPQTQTYYPPAVQNRGISTRTIVGISVAVLLFVVGPIVFAVMRAVGETVQENKKEQTEQLAEEQKAEAPELLNRAMNDARAGYPETNGDFFKLSALQEQMQAQIEAGMYNGENYRITSISLLREGENPIS